MIETLTYYLAEHPSIVNFRWSHSHSWGSTWSFLFSSIYFYLAFSIILHLFLLGIRRRAPVPLGPLPALHSLTMSLLSATIFLGLAFSAAAEIRDTRWFFGRFKTTPFQWLLCFPMGTRPSGRVFFWSYLFYLSRFLHMLRTCFTILRRRKLVYFQLFNNAILTFMTYLWLEYSQSFQVLAILLTTSLYSIIYGYRFWTEIGLPGACFPFVSNCRMVLLGCNLVCHVGVLAMHFVRGCNGIVAWGFNSVLNVAILALFLNFYVKTRVRKRSELRLESNNSSSSVSAESHKDKDA
ncbi:hypothetical protein QQ045_010975 [Rhodiola kirilowii]